MRKKKRANLSVEHRQLIKKLVTEMIKRQQQVLIMTRRKNYFFMTCMNSPRCETK